MTPIQCKMARAALSLGVRELAEIAKVDKATVSRFENGKDAYQSTAEKLKTALELSGQIRFESTNGVFYRGGSDMGNG